MYVSNTHIHRVMELHLHKVYAAQPTAGANAVSRADKLTISRQATEMHQIKQALVSLPDTRNDVVSDLRERISSGGYEVSEQQLAQNIFSWAMDGRLSN